MYTPACLYSHLTNICVIEPLLARMITQMNFQISREYSCWGKCVNQGIAMGGPHPGLPKSEPVWIPSLPVIGNGEGNGKPLFFPPLPSFSGLASNGLPQQGEGCGGATSRGNTAALQDHVKTPYRLQGLGKVECCAPSGGRDQSQVASATE